MLYHSEILQLVQEFVLSDDAVRDGTLNVERVKALHGNRNVRNILPILDAHVSDPKAAPASVDAARQLRHLYMAAAIAMRRRASELAAEVMSELGGDGHSQAMARNRLALVIERLADEGPDQAMAALGVMRPAPDTARKPDVNHPWMPKDGFLDLVYTPGTDAAKCNELADLLCRLPANME